MCSDRSSFAGHISTRQRQTADCYRTVRRIVTVVDIENAAAVALILLGCRVVACGIDCEASGESSRVHRERVGDRQLAHGQ